MSSVGVPIKFIRGLFARPPKNVSSDGWWKSEPAAAAVQRFTPLFPDGTGWPLTRTPPLNVPAISFIWFFPFMPAASRGTKMIHELNHRRTADLCSNLLAQFVGIIVTSFLKRYLS